MFFGRRKKGSKWAMLLVIMMFVVVAGMTISACGPGDDDGSDNPPITPPPTDGNPSNEGGGGTPTQTPIPAPPPTEAPIEECWSEVMLKEAELVAARVYFEGASSMEGDISSPDRRLLFEWMVFALKSLRDHDATAQATPYYLFSEWNYEGRQIISIADANNPSYGDCFKNPTTFQTCGYRAPSWAVDKAKEILSLPGCGISPFANAGEGVHWISPTNYPRNDLPGLHPIPISGCGEGCQMNDIRRLQYMRGYADAAGSVRLEEFKSFILPATNTEECYWRGVYFIKNSDWDAVYNPTIYLAKLHLNFPAA